MSQKEVVERVRIEVFGGLLFLFFHPSELWLLLEPNVREQI